MTRRLSSMLQLFCVAKLYFCFCFGSQAMATSGSACKHTCVYTAKPMTDSIYISTKILRGLIYVYFLFGNCTFRMQYFRHVHETLFGNTALEMYNFRAKSIHKSTLAVFWSKYISTVIDKVSLLNTEFHSNTARGLFTFELKCSGKIKLFAQPQKVYMKSMDASFYYISTQFLRYF